MTPQSFFFYKRLASLLADKRNGAYSAVMGWLRCVLSVILMRSAIRCVRGTRKRPTTIPTDNITVATVDSRLLNDKH